MPVIRPPRDPHDVLNDILDVFDSLRELKGIDAILDRILGEARRLVKADAGTIFLVRDDTLVFSYVHNDSLFSSDEVGRHAYLNASLPIDERSIAGYAALRGQCLVIDDAYSLDGGYPFHFNTAFDQKTGYRTRSILTLPIINSRGRTVAVMQIINALDGDGQPIPFTREDQTYLTLLANHAAAAIETGLMTSELVLRMNRMAELRDPGETGAHVQRVGAYSAEIYHKMAQDRCVPADELKRVKDVIRVAAMLHDVGKVGVPDGILKKPARLTAEEFDIMKLHTLHGARLFTNPASDLDVVAMDIALHHHQRFDGNGYPGFVTDLASDHISANPPLGGHDIPLPARIVALADVYDALTSRRVYKPPFNEDKALEILTADSGGHFDPEVVEAFMGIHDVILAIRTKFGEEAGG